MMRNLSGTAGIVYSRLKEILWDGFLFLNRPAHQPIFTTEVVKNEIKLLNPRLL